MPSAPVVKPRRDGEHGARASSPPPPQQRPAQAGPGAGRGSRKEIRKGRSPSCELGRPSVRSAAGDNVPPPPSEAPGNPGWERAKRTRCRVQRQAHQRPKGNEVSRSPQAGFPGAKRGGGARAAGGGGRKRSAQRSEGKEVCQVRRSAAPGLGSRDSDRAKRASPVTH